MIDAAALLDDAQDVTDLLVDDLRTRTEEHDETRTEVRGEYERASSAGRTDRTFEEWREDLLAQVAPAWTLATVFVRFCEDNGLVERPLLSGPGRAMELARGERTAWFREHPELGDRDWLHEVLRRYRELPGVGPILSDDNPLWQIAPTADGARALLELWWRTDDEGELLHDFTDEQLDTRFLGDLYQDLSEHARKQFALLQTPEFVEEFILDHTLDPALETFGLPDFRMIDPACGSGHFLLGAFDRLFAAWQQREPGTSARSLAQNALDSVNGVDINPFAVAVARFRLLVAALQACNVRQLRGAPNFDINAAAGDSLLHGSRGSRLLSGEEEFSGTLTHRYAFENDRADEILEADSYHAVVANPPYITVKDAAIRDAIRALYETPYGKYALSVPFAERLHDLALPATPTEEAGYVGQITANSFMKRQMGKVFVNEWLPTRDLTHVIDTSGAYIPGHGTPTVILFSRDRAARGVTRAVLGIRGEPGRPDDPATAEVWSAILRQIDKPGSESDFLSVDDVTDDRFASHPWSLQGGAAPDVMQLVESHASKLLPEVIDSSGVLGFTGQDPAYADFDARTLDRLAIEDSARRGFVEGHGVRDWALSASLAIYPYSDAGETPELKPGVANFLWPFRRRLAEVLMFSENKVERGKEWFEWNYIMPHRIRLPNSITFAEVATHNHFVMDRGGKVFKQTAPVIKLPDGASEGEHFALLGLLNSSVAEFWMKQVFHSKGSTVDSRGARQATVRFEDFYQRDSTKLKQFPIPDGAPTERAEEVDRLAQELADLLPAAVAQREVPTASALDAAAKQATELRRRMVALQEELDWECYRLYGLVDEDLTSPTAELPQLERGQRAFEVALARRIETGEATSTWFERHGSTPLTELPGDWPDDYRRLVRQRLDLIAEDRAIRLLEKPEHKRRWNWDDLEDLAGEAQERWLLDRIESLLADAADDEPTATTSAQLADRLAADDEAREVAQDLAGRGADLAELVDRLVRSDAVPYLAAHRHKPSGLRKRVEWEQVWELQRAEDELDARVELPEDDPDHLSEAEADVLRKEQGLDQIPVPPNYTKADFADDVTYRLRGKLDVPKERFIRYPQVTLGGDKSTVVGWAGWDHLQQLRALAALYARRKEAGAEDAELGRLLAGMVELLPWVKQWHNEPDEVYGERMGDVFASFVETERATLGLAAEDLTGGAPLDL